jgi:hypothetical protein
MNVHIDDKEKKRKEKEIFFLISINRLLVRLLIPEESSYIIRIKNEHR